MIALLLFLISISQKQIGDQPIVVDGVSDIYASEFIFISTPSGIHAFDRDGETWRVITEASGLPAGDVTLMGIDEGILWVATPHGFASADIKINDWQTYDLDGAVKGLAFDDEYVWVGGDFGMKRFDKYGETWEELTEVRVNDIWLEKDWVWLACDVGVLKYNHKFERIEEVSPAPEHPYYHIIDTPTRIWFLARESFALYDKAVEAWSEHDGFTISDYASLGDSLFVVSDGAVIVYEPNSDSWSPFRDIIELPHVNGISATGKQLCLSTDNGLHIYDWEERVRTTYNRTTGLGTDSLIDCYEDAARLFAVGPHAIEHLDEETGIWKVEQFQPAEKKREGLLYLGSPVERTPQLAPH